LAIDKVIAMINRLTSWPAIMSPCTCICPRWWLYKTWNAYLCLDIPDWMNSMLYISILYYYVGLWVSWWCNGRASDSRSKWSWVRFPIRSPSADNSRQVVHTHVPLSQSGINCYWQKPGSKQAIMRHTGPLSMVLQLQLVSGWGSNRRAALHQWALAGGWLYLPVLFTIVQWMRHCVCW